MAYPNEPVQGIGGQDEYGSPQTGFTHNDDRFTHDEPAAGDRAREVASTAQSEAHAVADTAKEAGGHVLDTAKQEAGQVLDEAKFQGRRLLDESVSELRTQAGAGQHMVAELARSLSSELGQMSGASQDGMLGDYVNRAQRLTDEAASWLDSHEPEELLTSVRRYAARNPWQFLAISAGVGFIGARLVRGLQGAKADQPDDVAHRQARPTYPSESVVADPAFQPAQPAQGDWTTGATQPPVGNDPWQQGQR